MLEGLLGQRIGTWDKWNYLDLLNVCFLTFSFEFCHIIKLVSTKEDPQFLPIKDKNLDTSKMKAMISN